MVKKLMLLVLIAFSSVNADWLFEVPTPAIDSDLYENVLNEELCAEQIRSIRRTPILTMMFADASSRVPRGFLDGNMLDLGNYHQCLNINYPLPDSVLQGKHCAISVPLNQTFQLPNSLFNADSLSNTSLLELNNENIRNVANYEIVKRKMQVYTGMIDDNRMAGSNPLSGFVFSLAVCVPRSCTTQQVFDTFLFNVTAVGFQYTDLYCRLPDDRPIAPAVFAGIAVVSIIGLVTLLSTSYDLWQTFIKKADNETISVVGKSFSVYTNGRRLMTFSSGANTIECLDGIRVLAMAWVVLGHTFTTEIDVSNPIDVFLWISSWQSIWVSAGHYAVDTFFMLSGFLVVYSTVGKINGKQLLKNLHLFYLNRLLRMFPLLAMAVLFEASYMNHMTDGPNWINVASHVDKCRATWWSTLLHVQNLVSPRMMCIIPSWYLAIDVQLHILSPIILVWVLWGRKRIAWTALAAGFLSILTASTIYNFLYEFPPSMGGGPGSQKGLENYVLKYYLNTLPRSPPFFVGMLFGYLVRVSKTKLTRLGVAVYWICFFSLSTFLIYFEHPIGKSTWDNQVMTNIYNSFFRCFWATVVGCLIYACVNGFGGPINWFLSLRIWKLQSRLSYGIYLFHHGLMVAINSTGVVPVFFSVGSITFKFLSFYFLAMAVSYLLSLTVDAPCSTLFKLLLGNGVKKQTKKDDDDVPESTKQENNKNV